MLIIAQIMLQINLNFSINEHVKNLGIMVTNETSPMAKVDQTKILNVASSKMKLSFTLMRDVTTSAKITSIVIPLMKTLITICSAKYILDFLTFCELGRKGTNNDVVVSIHLGALCSSDNNTS